MGAGKFVTRFAPSPTGHLHLGHACSAFHVWDTARTHEGTVLLRIEDIDRTGCRPEYETSIVEDLAWLGLDWPPPLRRQSDHFAEYEAALDSLRARGLVYRCFKTRREIAAALPAGASPDTAGFTSRPLPPSREQELLDRGQAFAWRLSLAEARSQLGARYDRLGYAVFGRDGERFTLADPAPFGDVVLARKDTPTSYHLACCHDDALQGVTHVIRGEDIRDMTAIHVLLQALMDWPQPFYAFHPLVLGADGKKLSKRAGDRGLRVWREDGKTPEDIRAMTGFLP